jgi:hypothetical protein
VVLADRPEETGGSRLAVVRVRRREEAGGSRLAVVTAGRRREAGARPRRLEVAMERLRPMVLRRAVMAVRRNMVPRPRKGRKAPTARRCSR